jgi:hypothetical protein
MKIWLILGFIILSKIVGAQEMWGISNSNFAGNMGIFLNPSTIVGAPYQYEINVFAFDAFAENTNNFFSGNDKIINHTLTGSLRNERRVFDDPSAEQNSFSHLLVIGPSYIRNKTTWGWGIHTAYREQISVLNIPPQVVRLLRDRFSNPLLFGVKDSLNEFSSAYASWLELGGTYGKIIRDSEHHILKWGVNANALLGINGSYTDVRDFNFTSLNSSSLEINDVNATLAHAANDPDDSFFALRGFGFSTTFGINYINHPNRSAFDCVMSNDLQKKYKYRLGLSIIDLGMIRFSNEAQVTSVMSDSTIIWNGIDSLQVNSLSDINSIFVTRFRGTSENQDFSIWLPLSVGLQFDYQIRANVFANLSVIKRIQLGINQLARGDQQALSVRYERRRFEANLNLSLFEYKQPSLGFALRYWYFVIGSDRLLQLIGSSDAHSYDLFFGFRFQFCKKPFSKGPDCPAFR